jgi:hypothetical protein
MHDLSTPYSWLLRFLWLYMSGVARVLGQLETILYAACVLLGLGDHIIQFFVL